MTFFLYVAHKDVLVARVAAYWESPNKVAIYGVIEPVGENCVNENHVVVLDVANLLFWVHIVHK